MVTSQVAVRSQMPSYTHTPTSWIGSVLINLGDSQVAGVHGMNLS